LNTDFTTKLFRAYHLIYYSDAQAVVHWLIVENIKNYIFYLFMQTKLTFCGPQESTF